MFIIRWVLGRIILFFDFVFSPKSPKRSADEQANIDESTRHLKLYQLPACPFCVKVRRANKRAGLNIEVRNINKSRVHLNELVNKGGKRTVPCLRISKHNEPEEWLYESKEIINYLSKYVPTA